jgi:hypothetical protein
VGGESPLSLTKERQMTEIGKALNMEDIFKSFPSNTRMQPKYRVKVIFLNTSKSEPSYTPVRVFSVNGNRYSVVDGGTAYMPKEAYSALTDAVGYIAKPKNSMQKEYGLNADDLSDKYDKVPVPNYDLTILDEFYPVQKGSKIIHMSKEDYSAYMASQKSLDEVEEIEEMTLSESDIKTKERADRIEDEKEKKNFSAIKATIKAEAEALTEAMIRED